jgi:hypothetical protein
VLTGTQNTDSCAMLAASLPSRPNIRPGVHAADRLGLQVHQHPVVQRDLAAEPYRVLDKFSGLSQVPGVTRSGPLTGGTG